MPPIWRGRGFSWNKTRLDSFALPLGCPRPAKNRMFRIRDVKIRQGELRVCSWDVIGAVGPFLPRELLVCHAVQL